MKYIRDYLSWPQESSAKDMIRSLEEAHAAMATSLPEDNPDLQRVIYWYKVSTKFREIFPIFGECYYQDLLLVTGNF